MEIERTAFVGFVEKEKVSNPGPRGDPATFPGPSPLCCPGASAPARPGSLRRLPAASISPRPRGQLVGLPYPPVCPGQGKLSRAASSSPGVARHPSAGEASCDVFIISLPPFPHLPCLLRIQEANSEKTNNGIHYRLQLLYSNGKGWESPGAAPTPPPRGTRAAKPDGDPGSRRPGPLCSAHPRSRCPAGAGGSGRDPRRLRALGRAQAWSYRRRPAPLLTPLPCFRDQDGTGFLRSPHRLHDQTGEKVSSVLVARAPPAPRPLGRERPGSAATCAGRSGRGCSVSGLRAAFAS